MQWCTPDPTMLECTQNHCQEINWKQYVNRQGQISLFLWNQIIRENYGYRFKIVNDHIDSHLCGPAWIWKVE
jgi:hypothetical protein